MKLQREKDERYQKMMVKQKELENFKEKHEEIFQTERNEANDVDNKDAYVRIN